jgi:beta-barrel assembly-enhancing protease
MRAHRKSSSASTSGKTILRAVALAGMALATGLWAQSSSGQTNTPQNGSPSAQPSQPGEQSQGQPAQQPAAPAQQPSASAQPAPGTTPVGGDAPAPAKQPDNSGASAPGGTPAGTAQVNPCPTNGPDNKKDKKKDKDNAKDSADSADDAAPGTTPVGGDCVTTDTGDKVDPEKVVDPGSQMEKVKPGSIEDVGAVGNRDIGARGMGNWYSTDSEIKMGKQYADEIEKSTRFITDPVIDEYVNRIGQNIVKNSDCKVPFTIKVIDSDEINAMALPGGFFYVNSGLILAADEEAELAGVMAHETAHVCAHHAAREMTRANYAQLSMIPLIMVTGYSWTGYGIYEAAQLAIPITFLEFSREFEAQADFLGVQYMYRAGYDPQAFISFFEKIQALEKRKPGLVAKAFSDHPQTPDRILHTQEEIARFLPAKSDYLVTTSEFDDVKARLARIENKRRLTDTKGVTRPSLRRVSTDPNDPNASSGDDGTTNSNGSDNGNGNDQPTLHRRDDQQN